MAKYFNFYGESSIANMADEKAGVSQMCSYTTRSTISR